MLKFLMYGFLLISVPLNAQYFAVSDFHSDFEKKTFEQLKQNKLVDPSSFLIAAESKNGLNEYRDFSLLLKSIPLELNTSKMDRMDFEKKLKYIFKTTQKKYFNSYQLYESYSDLLEKGDYNCISGTAFYALLLSEMGYKIHIYETPFHAYLEVENENGEFILIESTDAAFGVVDKMKNVKSRREEYAQGQSEFVARGLGNASENPEEIFTNEINLFNLAGLQYYNLAVLAFNEGEFEKASKLLKKAAYLYPSSRIIMLQLLSEELIASNY
ncbi:hypothetical protein HZR84_06980 [Hyphobacterium sp. CCMP332]|nr:hypothetical protein HZR84_06980 [Hyphobacterium sp. CCMP332]